MRKIALTVIYLAMILVGLGMLATVLLHGGKIFIAAGGGSVAALGIYLAWTDFFSSERL